jgi:hypothetical protein
MNSLHIYTGHNRMRARMDNDILVENYKRRKNTYFQRLNL